MDRLIRVHRIVAIVSLSIGVAAVDAQTPAGWLPTDAAMGMAVQLTQREETLRETPSIDRSAVISRAVERVSRVGDVIGRRSAAQATAAAPVPPGGITLPTTDDARLKAAVRYQLCNAVLLADFEQGTTVEARQEAARRLTVVALLQAHLLFPYLNDGGRPSVVQAVMTGPEMAAALATLEADRSQRSQVRTDCGRLADPLVLLLGE